MNKPLVGLEKWHEFITGRDEEVLAKAIAQEAVFHSPFVWTPKAGKANVVLYLSSAATVLENFTYHREFRGDNAVTLEFSANVGEIMVKGVDIIQFDAEGKIIDFEVMVRPNKALQALAAAMGKQLEQKATS